MDPRTHRVRARREEVRVVRVEALRAAVARALLGGIRGTTRTCDIQGKAEYQIRRRNGAEFASKIDKSQTNGTLPSVEIALIDGAKSDYNVIHIKTNEPVESLASVTAVGVAPGASDAFAASTFSREYFIATASKAGSALAI